MPIADALVQIRHVAVQIVQLLLVLQEGGLVVLVVAHYVGLI